MNNKKEYIKCLKDPYYFIKKYCFIKDKRTNKLINIKWTKLQIEMLTKMLA